MKSLLPRNWLGYLYQIDFLHEHLKLIGDDLRQRLALVRCTEVMVT